MTPAEPDRRLPEDPTEGMPAAVGTRWTHLLRKEHDQMQPNSQVPTLNTIALSRLAGLCAIAFVLTALLGLTGALGGDLYFSDAGPNEILAWINQNGQLISVSAFLSGLESTLFYGGLIVLLVELTHARGILPVLAYLGVVITVLISWTQAGMAYAMVDLASRGGADAGVLALFTLGKTMQFTDGVGFALAVGCTSLLAMRAGALPTWLVWYGLVVAVFHVVDDPFRIFGLTFVGPIGVVLGLLWILAVGVALLVKPVRLFQAREATALARA